VKEGMIEDLQQELQSIIHWPMLWQLAPSSTEKAGMMRPIMRSMSWDRYPTVWLVGYRSVQVQLVFRENSLLKNDSVCELKINEFSTLCSVAFPCSHCSQACDLWDVQKIMCQSRPMTCFFNARIIGILVMTKIWGDLLEMTKASTFLSLLEFQQFWN
jgi:hypothetical protein